MRHYKNCELVDEEFYIGVNWEVTEEDLENEGTRAYILAKLEELDNLHKKDYEATGLTRWLGARDMLMGQVEDAGAEVSWRGGWHFVGKKERAALDAKTARLFGFTKPIKCENIYDDDGHPTTHYL